MEGHSRREEHAHQHYHRHQHHATGTHRRQEHRSIQPHRSEPTHRHQPDDHVRRSSYPDRSPPSKHLGDGIVDKTPSPERALSTSKDAHSLKPVIHEYTMWSIRRVGYFWECRSKASLCGYPIVHITNHSWEPGVEACRWACGWFALGPLAVGCIAIGYFAVGAFAIGLLSIAIAVAVGIVAASGIAAIGNVAAAVLFSIGNLALGITSTAKW